MLPRAVKLSEVPCPLCLDNNGEADADGGMADLCSPSGAFHVEP